VRAAAALVACAAALFAGACSDDDDAASPDGTDPPQSVATAPPERPEPEAPRLKEARCPSGLSNCKSASGRIVYVERVDPDGDGDAHFVLDSKQSVTLSVIDVKKSLRPDPLPDVGDWISAAGPVYRGSYGQKQIEAIELHVARARRG
jgi:hypothetical protein